MKQNILVLVLLLFLPLIALRAAEPAQKMTIGVAHVGGLYRFTEHHFLDEGAAEIEKLGAKCIKVYLTLDSERPAKVCYPFGSEWPECATLKELAASPPFQRLFEKTFETYVLTTFRGGKPAGYWKDAITDEDATAEEDEFYLLARFLLRTYRGTRKTFVLQNWEGDWAVRGNYDPKTDPNPAALERMTQWLQARQRGVEHARRDEPADGVSVLHAVEVCLLRGGMDEGRPCVANRVVPKVVPDLVSYSCWELQEDPVLLRRGLDWLATQTPSRPPFGARNIFIGEFGSPENVFPPDKQRAMIEGTLRVAREFGCPLAIYWQVYCNEAVNKPVKSNKDVRGFGLVRPDGTRTLACELLRDSVQHADVIFKPGEKVAFLGDSITAQGWSNAHGYVKLVVAGLDANGVKIVPVPAGVGGHKSNDMLARLKRDVIDKKPDWVTISCGMNDVIHGAKGVPLDQYKANMTDIVAQCQAAGIKVLLFTTTTAGTWNSDQSKQLGEFSAFLRELAKDKQCVLVDLYPEFAETLKKSDTLRGLTGDGVHMTPEDNMLIARTVLATVGLDETQLAKARETWLDLPDAGSFNTRLDVELNKKFFTASCSLTLRQRERVLDAAAMAKRPTLSHWSKDLLHLLMKKKLQPAGSFDSLEAMFAPDVKDKVQSELQQEFVAEIRRITQP